MAKPILLIKTDKNVLLNPSKMEEFTSIFRTICDSVGDEYHVIAMTKEYDVAVLNGEYLEITDEKWEHILKTIKGE